jgi:hypothetical protein
LNGFAQNLLFKVSREATLFHNVDRHAKPFFHRLLESDYSHQANRTFEPHEKVKVAIRVRGSFGPRSERADISNPVLERDGFDRLNFGFRELMHVPILLPIC